MEVFLEKKNDLAWGWGKRNKLGSLGWQALGVVN